MIATLRMSDRCVIRDRARLVVPRRGFQQQSVDYCREHEISHPRLHRHAGQSPLPGSDDVRSVGRAGSRPVDPDHPSRPRRRRQLYRHRRRVLGGRVRGDRRQGARGRSPRRRDPGDEVPRQDGRRPERRRHLPALDRARGREQPAAAEDRLDRPLPDPPPARGHRRRRDARRAVATSSTPARCARSAARPSPPARSSRRSGRPSAAGASASCASSRRTRSSCAGWRRTCCRPASATAWA